MALFTLHPLSVTLATSFAVVLVVFLTGVEILEGLREGSRRGQDMPVEV